MYCKRTDRKSFLPIDSEHPKLLKVNILYSQALRIIRICTTLRDFKHHYKELKQWFLEQGYDSELLNKQIKTVEKLDSNELMKNNKNIHQQIHGFP